MNALRADFKYGVRMVRKSSGPTDASSFGGVAILFAGIAALACYVPGQPAMTVDPMVALRYER